MTGQKIDGTTYGFPKGMSQPSLRALLEAGYTSLSAVAAATEKELLDMHGMGPKGIRLLREALAAEGRTFAAKKGSGT